jgi:elongation factor P--beta-lysine ligase
MNIIYSSAKTTKEVLYSYSNAASTQISATAVKVKTTVVDLFQKIVNFVQAHNPWHTIALQGHTIALLEANQKALEEQIVDMRISNMLNERSVALAAESAEDERIVDARIEEMLKERKVALREEAFDQAMSKAVSAANTCAKAAIGFISLASLMSIAPNIMNFAMTSLQSYNSPVNQNNTNTKAV